MTSTMPAKYILSAAIILCLSSSTSLAQDSPSLPETAPWANNYQQTLAEEMLADGRILLEQRSFADAERVFFDALQVVKINNGVTSTLQLPVLKLLIESLLPQGKWEAIQQYLSYFDWLNTELYRTNVADFLAGTEVLSSLYLQASADITNPSGAHYLVASKNLYWNAVSAIEGVYGRQSNELTPWLYRLVLSHFYQSSLLDRRGLTSYDYKTDEPAIVNGWSLSKNESLEKSYNIGSELLRRIRDIEFAQGNHEAQAIAWLYMADWETTFDNGAKALEFYEKAHQLLLDSGATQSTIDALFAQTTVLPEPSFKPSLAELITQPAGLSSVKQFTAWSENYPAAQIPAAISNSSITGLGLIQAKVSFDYNQASAGEFDNNGVNRNLFVKSNITLIAISEDIEAAKTKALNDVSLLHLRPKLISGELVPSKGITVDYQFSRQATPLLLSDN